MELTPEERRVLQIYVAWRERPPTVARLFALHWKRYLFLIVVMGAVCAWFELWGLTNFVYWSVGVLVGALLRDVGIFIRSVRFWPVQSAVMDWGRVEELLTRSEQSSSPT